MTTDPRRALLTERESITCRLAGLDAPGGSGRGDWNDAAVEHSARESVAVDRERLRARVQAIDAAVERITAGSYGRCTECGEAIAPARLTARPEAETCVGCATRAETAAADTRRSSGSGWARDDE